MGNFFKWTINQDDYVKKEPTNKSKIIKMVIKRSPKPTLKKVLENRTKVENKKWK